MVRRGIGGIIAILLLASVATASSAVSSPPYARVGAYASYTAQGGYIPYFSGVEGNITYTVSAIFGNGSMGVRVFINITAGTDLNPFVETLNTTDTIVSPRDFPAVPLANLSSGHLEFQNVSASFIGNATVSVPAGEFQTVEYGGMGANSTTEHFWFDKATGLMVQESSGTSAIELDSSNIAVPTSPPNTTGAEVPIELVFVITFLVGGGLFLFVRYYYTNSAQRRKSGKSAKPDRKN